MRQQFSYVTKIENRVGTNSEKNVCASSRSLYIFEMKYEESAQAAIDQIYQMKYFQRYLKTEKEIVFIGILFANRNVAEVIWEIPDRTNLQGRSD